MTDDEKGVVIENARDYLTNPTQCIYCLSEHIQVSDGPDLFLSHDEGKVINTVFIRLICKDCRSSFVEEHRLVAVHWDEEESVREDDF